ncbi:MAG: phage major capsid protein [Steroidobacteraceae bacterium]|nr:phage major capsid protein [Nevskiaceae bacterium]MCP5359905.1 phage major capsid protein [Nevskiaceae bacterium]MCP5472276.1 phage major capsid protein [Nevskiaceae bacterium]
MTKTLQLPKLTRAASDVFVRALAGKDDGHARFEVTVSSETPVQRWFGAEILLHDAAAVDLSRFNDSAPVLLEHARDQQLGVIEPGSARIVGRKLKLVMRFSRANPAAQLVAADIADGIRRNVSVSYIPLRARLAASSEEDGDTWEIVRWQPLECSIVSVPADASVGFDRAAGQQLYDVEVEEPAATPNTSRTPARSPRIETTLRTRAMPETNESPTRGERRAAASANAAVTDRAASIAHMCASNGIAHRAAEFIESDLTADAVARAILDEQLGRSAAPSGRAYRQDVQRGALGHVDEELPRGYSLRSAILSALEGGNSLEREWSDSYARQSGRALRGDGIFVHPSAMAPVAQRTMTSFNTGAAPELVSETPGELIPVLRAASRVVSLGARVLPSLRGPVPFPKQRTDSTAYWVQENPGSDVTESNPTFGVVTLAPKTLQGSTPFSRQLLQQASINVEQLVRSSLTASHGKALDRAAIHGSGFGSEPLGIFKTPDVNTESIAGAPDFTKLVSMMTKIASDDAYAGSLGWLTTPQLAGKLMSTLEFSSYGGKAIWTGGLLEGQAAGHRAAVSTLVSSTMSTLEPTGGSAHGIVFGNWNDLLIGLFGAMELTVDPYTLAKRGIIQVTSFQMVDIALLHGESFCVGTGATAS